MAVFRPFPTATLFLYLITLSQPHFTTSKPTGFSIKLIPRDSPESPIYPGNLTQLERIDRLIKFSKARAHYIESTSTPNATLSPDNMRFTLLRDNFFYMVQVGIGSQNLPVYFYMDTGGGLIWTQCAPCKNCYKQNFPLYDSQASISYRKLPCDHPLCQGGNVFQCVNGECVYNVNYGGGALTKGVASFETFVIPIDTANTQLFENIIFGCSNDNQNIQFAKNGVISGVMGLGMSPESLVNQLTDEVDGRFSYCLVPFTEAMQVPSVLRFGDDIPQPTTNLQSTKFATPQGSHYYYLNLLDISVGFGRLGFAPDIFKIRRDGKGGCIIDSGALISQIDQNTVGRNAYRAVMAAFQAYYDNIKLERVTKSVPEGFQLCYKTPQGDFRNYATMTYHFDGADYILDGKYVNFFNNEQGYFCVALVPGNARTILGAWHQQNMRMIYNVNVGALQFSTEICAKDNP